MVKTKKYKHMKKIILYILLAVSIVSCYEDEGNYDYTEPDLVEVSGVTTDTTYQLFVGDVLVIEPEVTTTLADDDIEYRWMVEDDTLSTERNFNMKLFLPPGSYDLKYQILDRSADLRYEYETNVEVATIFTEGWHLLCNDKGQTHFNFLSHVVDTTMKLNVFEELNGVPLLGAPYRMRYAENYGPNGREERITFISKEGAADLLDINPITCEKVKEHRDEFMGFDQHIGEYKPTAYAFARGNGLIASNGKIYLKTGANTLDGSNYLAPLAGDYMASNHLSYAASAMPVFYDDKNQRYLSITINNGAGKIKELLFEDTSKFDISNTGKECVYLETYEVTGSRSKRFVVTTILKGENAYYLQAFNLLKEYDENWRIMITPKPMFQIEFPIGTVDETSCFAINSDYASFYIGTGKNIHMVNLESGGLMQNVKSFDKAITAITPFGKRITRESESEYIPCLALGLNEGETSEFVEVSAELAYFGEELTSRQFCNNGVIVSMIKN